MAKELKARITAAQTDLLCTFFEENPEVLRGYRKTPKCVSAVQSKWKKITRQLNSLGPPFRDHKGWAKYLCDMKAKLKKKKIKWRLSCDGASPIMCNTHDFNEIKLRMLQILRKDSLNVQESQSQDSHPSDVDTDDDDGKDDFYEDVNNQIDVFSEENPEIKTNADSPEYVTLSPNEASQSDLLTYQRNNDEFDTFGRNVAQQLRTLPLSVALETQEMLLAILRKQRIQVLSESSTGNDPLKKHY